MSKHWSRSVETWKDTESAKTIRKVFARRARVEIVIVKTPGYYGVSAQPLDTQLPPGVTDDDLEIVTQCWRRKSEAIEWARQYAASLNLQAIRAAETVMPKVVTSANPMRAAEFLLPKIVKRINGKEVFGG